MRQQCDKNCKGGTRMSKVWEHDIKMFTAPSGGGYCNELYIMKSDLTQKGQVTFPRSHSSGRARAQTQRGQDPELLAWKRRRWEKPGWLHQMRLERWARSLTCLLPGPPSSASPVPDTSGLQTPTLASPLGYSLSFISPSSPAAGLLVPKARE